MSKLLFTCAGALLSLHLSVGQTKVSGSLECASPDFRQETLVGDRAGHTMVLSQRQCHWAQPLTIVGVLSRNDVLSLFTDIRQDQVTDRGYDVMVMSNGDKIFLHFFGLSRTNSEMPSSSEGTLSFSGGTGRFLGIYGSGTLTSRRSADGKITVRLDGQYTVPAWGTL